MSTDREASAAGPAEETQASLVPNAKVQAGAASGAVGIVVVWIATQIGLDMSAEVGAAIGLLMATAGAYLKSE